MSNQRIAEYPFQPYLLLTPQTPIQYRKKNERIHFPSIDILSSVSAADHESYSTPNTFIGTPPNFSFEDYDLNESIKISEKVIFKNTLLIFYCFHFIFSGHS
jgi:hypothetical protein